MGGAPCFLKQGDNLILRDLTHSHRTEGMHVEGEGKESVTVPHTMSKTMKVVER